MLFSEDAVSEMPENDWWGWVAPADQVPSDYIDWDRVHSVYLDGPEGYFFDELVPQEKLSSAFGVMRDGTGGIQIFADLIRPRSACEQSLHVIQSGRPRS
jgi:hypothetical protein